LDVTAQAIEVNVNIVHTWRGDLKVSLVSPAGEELVLINRTGGSRDDIVQAFRSSDEPDLFAPLIGASARGDWRLRVADMARRDVGTIAKWGLAITY
jgi:subtilisin-like proprotein convertase family protein